MLDPAGRAPAGPEVQQLHPRLTQIGIGGRRAIAQALRLETYGEGDELPDVERERLVIQRAQERGQLAALWDAAEAAHADRVPPANPFAPEAKQ